MTATSPRIVPHGWNESLRSLWWLHDYSWDGLARRRLPGYAVSAAGELVPDDGSSPGRRPATLQDYWRTEEPHLVTERGRDGTLWRWTRPHLPTTFRDGASSGKASWTDAQWQQIEDVLESRLKSAGSTSKPDQQDNRAQFQGIVVRTLPLPRDAPVNMTAEDARFLAPFHSSHVQYGPNLDFRAAVFEQAVTWEHAGCADTIQLGQALFLDAASFAHTSFGGRAWMGTFFGGPTTFAGGTFKDPLFMGAHFFDAATFVGVTFEDRAHFAGVPFYQAAAFDRASFAKGATFVEATFGDPDHPVANESSFIDARFGGRVEFDHSVFHTAAVFSGALFDDSARRLRVSLGRLDRFKGRLDGFGAQFTDVTFHAQATFEGAGFTVDAGFDRTTFAEALFIRTTFGDDVSMAGTQFSGDARFDGARFARIARFDGLTCRARMLFDSAAFAADAGFDASVLDECTRVSFKGTVFGAASTFRDVRWPGMAAAYVAAFRDVAFPKLADFSAANFSAFSMFDGTRFGGEVRFLPETLRQPLTFDAALAAAGGDLELLLSLENGYRALKVGSENTRDRAAEQMFYRQELICRRRQDVTPRSEKLFSRMYGELSDYGTSMTRPLSWLLVIWAIFAGVYWLTGWTFARGALNQPVAGGASQTIAGTVADALSLSGHVMFAPFGAWGGTFAASSFDDVLLKQAGPLVSLPVRLLATVQSVCTIVLLFLSGLAVRRRFQIN